MLQTTSAGHVLKKGMDYARRHRILEVVPKRLFSVCDRLGPDLFLFMKTLGVFLHDQTLFGCSIFQNGAHCPHPSIRDRRGREYGRNGVGMRATDKRHGMWRRDLEQLCLEPKVSKF